MEEQNTYDWLVKVLIIGDSAVGKTQILNRFAENKFSQNKMATLGLDFKIKTIQVGGNRIKMQIWDTAGQDKFRSITETYYRGASGIIITYSISDRNSFKNVQKWIQQIQMNLDDSIPKILIGNKCDLQRVVDASEGRNLAQSYGMEFLETSAKENISIKDIFQRLGESIKERIEQTGGLENNNNADQNRFNLGQTPNQLNTSNEYDIDQFKSKSSGGCSC